MKQPYLLLGEIVKPQGIRGEVKVRHYTDDPYRFQELDTLYRKNGSQYSPIRVLGARVQKDDVFLKLEGVNDRDQAEALRGCELWVDREHARQLEEGQFFIAEILGAKAYDTKGNVIGVLTDVFNTGSTDVFTFEVPGGTLMVPYLETVMLSVDA